MWCWSILYIKLVVNFVVLYGFMIILTFDLVCLMIILITLSRYFFIDFATEGILLIVYNFEEIQ